VILQSFKSLFTDSSYIKFGVLLSLFPLLVRLITPLWIGASAGLRWTCPNHLKRYGTNFSSIGTTPNLSHMLSFRIRSLLMCPQVHRSMCILATLSCWTCNLYANILLHITWSVGSQSYRICLFRFCGTLGSHKTPEPLCHFNQLILISLCSTIIVTLP
jgi:hypothetical protein